MSRHVTGLIASSFLVSSFVGLAGCGELVGLGPSATLGDASTEASSGSLPDATAPSEASSSDAPVAEAGGEAGAPEGGYVCGLQPQGYPPCDSCDNDNCCDVSIACSKNPRCVEGTMMLENCVYDAKCVDLVDSEYADSGLNALQSCTVLSCIGPCFPGPICSQLATCCKDIPTDLPSALQVCISSVNKLVESGCESLLDNILRPQLGSQFCTGAPEDAGGD
jgi:hypothetical protein